eukprot:CFRG7324T1
MFDFDFFFNEVPRMRNVPIDCFIQAPIPPKRNSHRITNHDVKLETKWGTHHTKCFCLFYPYGMRLIICTANMLDCDWHNKNQGIYAQDFPLKLEDSSTSPFEEELATYFGCKHYKYIDGTGKCVLPMDKMKKYDFTLATAHLIPSVPGKHRGADMHKYGSKRVTDVLRHVDISKSFMSSNSTIDCQFSSLGSLSAKWIEQWKTALMENKDRATSRAKLRLVIPTTEEVRNSIEGWCGGGEIPMYLKNHKPFLRDYLYRFGYNGATNHARNFRECALPHIKTYTLRNNDTHSLAWFMLTSSNLSRTAWGQIEQPKQTYKKQYRTDNAYNTDTSTSTSALIPPHLHVQSYELGVLFEPVRFYKNAREACAFTNTPGHQLNVWDNSDSKYTSHHEPMQDSLFTCSSAASTDGGGGRRIYFALAHNTPGNKYDDSDSPWSIDYTTTKEGQELDWLGIRRCEWVTVGQRGDRRQVRSIVMPVHEASSSMSSTIIDLT